MARYHRKDDGTWGKCGATKQPCPKGGDLNHIEADTPQELAQKIEAYEQDEGLQETLRHQKYVYTHKGRLRQLRHQVGAKTNRIVDQVQNTLVKRINRKNSGARLVAEPGTNMERAKARIRAALDYAKRQGNEHLMRKIGRAKVLSTGSFQDNTGKRFNIDTVLKEKSRINHINDQTQTALAEMSTIIRDHSHEFRDGDKFQVKNSAGSFTVTVAPSINQDAYDALPGDVKKQISTEKTTYSVDKAREHLDRRTYNRLVSRTDVMDVVLAKREQDDFSSISYRTTSLDTRGKTGRDMMEDSLNHVGGMYERFREENQGAGLKTAEANYKKRTTQIKDSIATRFGRKDNFYVPARSLNNGALISHREYFTKPSELHQEIPVETLVKIRSTRYAPDVKKARAVLTPEQFAQVFPLKAKMRKVLTD